MTATGGSDAGSLTVAGVNAAVVVVTCDPLACDFVVVVVRGAVGSDSG
jgi:hypothetical protein